LWSIAGVVPGALAAAFLIGQYHITDQMLQDAVSISLAFLSMLVIQVVFLVVGRIRALSMQARRYFIDRTVHPENVILDTGRSLLILLAIIVFWPGPFVLAGYAVYWYFTHPSTSANVAATGAGAALALKVVVVLFNSIVIPAIKAIFVKGFWHWLFGDKAKPRGA
jgi:hypothetical protein